MDEIVTNKSAAELLKPYYNQMCKVRSMIRFLSLNVMLNAPQRLFPIASS